MFQRRLICGVTGDVISVPLVEVILNSTLGSGTFLCGLVFTLPEGIALTIGNDLHCSDAIADVDVVTTRSMTENQTDKNVQPATQNSLSEPQVVQKN